MLVTLRQMYKTLSLYIIVFSSSIIFNMRKNFYLIIVNVTSFNLNLGVRAAAAESLPYLLDCAKLRGDDYVYQMWQYMNKELFKAIEIEPDHEVLGELFSSLGKVMQKNKRKRKKYFSYFDILSVLKH